MRTTQKIVVILILALATWFGLMMAASRFQGHQSNRILLVELGSDAASLTKAVQANGEDDRDGIAHNIQMVVRNTHLDFVFIFLYWLTFLGLSYRAGRRGQPILAVCAAFAISAAAVADLLENDAILVAMHVKNFTDAVAVDIWEYSQAKWVLFFLAVLLLGLSIALNRGTSNLRRSTGGILLASGVLGMMGIAGNRVSLGFTIVMINLGILLFAVALLLTLWKLYQPVNQTARIEQPHRNRIAA